MYSIVCRQERQEINQMAKQKTIEGGEIEIDVAAIKKSAGNFVAKEFERDNYPLLKKNDLEDQTFLVFAYSKITDEDGGIYYNFKALDKKDNPFCFNGSNVLSGQLEDNGMPCWVKLIRKQRDDKLRPYYWVFTAPEI